MNRLLARLLLGLSLALGSLSAWGAGTTFESGALSGLNEVPPNASTGTGFASVFYGVDSQHALRVNATFSDLLGNVTAAHIHCCTPPGSNAGVATAVPTFPGFPMGVKSGTYSQIFDLSLASSFNPAFITANGGTVAGAEKALVDGLIASNAYFNIHTDLFPGGEIRANLLMVPEPSTYAMLVAGLVLVGAAARRRRH